MGVSVVELRQFGRDSTANATAHRRGHDQSEFVFLVIETQIERSPPLSSILASKHAITNGANHLGGSWSSSEICVEERGLEAARYKSPRPCPPHLLFCTLSFPTASLPVPSSLSPLFANRQPHLGHVWRGRRESETRARIEKCPQSPCISVSF